jgi:cytoskeletal protein CcmA (bactofilin family)
MASEITTLLGAGTKFEGKLFFEGCVRIDGAFNGEIRSRDTLIVGEEAAITGNVFVGTAIVRGSVKGDILATEAIELYIPGNVEGNVKAPQVSMERGVTFQGQCTMGAVDFEVESGDP